ncbi:MAG: phosphotransferase family protein [Flavobacteriaceae bacterium]|jgi:aminoglycoside phosphotransferase (APT) family kinase protein|nr:phosphotransferase family protein [Flavobacteriaceae bacterium]
MAVALDKAKKIRKGEGLDEDALKKYLSEKLKESNGTLHVSQFPSGFSNLTYLISFADKEYVLRRPPFGANIKSGHDMSREFKILSALKGSYDKAPHPILFEEKVGVLDAPFYLMERVQGTILRAGIKEENLPTPKQFKSLSNNFVDTLVELHQLDYKAIGLETLGNPEGYTTRQVEGWGKRYQKSKTSNVETMEKTALWLQENIPPTSGASLIHNDFKYDNLVLTPDENLNIKAVLDWEMTTLGNPLMDLGTSLGYWVHESDPDFIAQNQLSLTSKPGNPSRGELVSLYEKKSGKTIDNIEFYFVFGVFKIAVIVQQIYSRYSQGHTKDPRFKNLDKIVELYGMLAQQAIKKKRIDYLF